jgi:hypothetical protein
MAISNPKPNLLIILLSIPPDKNIPHPAFKDFVFSR